MTRPSSDALRPANAPPHTAGFGPNIGPSHLVRLRASEATGLGTVESWPGSHPGPRPPRTWGPPRYVLEDTVRDLVDRVRASNTPAASAGAE